MRLVVLLSLLLAASGTHTADSAAAGNFDIGPWRLGMSKEQVASFVELGPYQPVAITGGLETRNGSFLGKPANVSFVFDPSGLQFIQVWKYEGKDAHAAQEAVVEIFRMFDADLGGAEIENITVSGPGGTAMSEPALRVVLGRILGTAQELTGKFRREQDVEATMMFDMRPRTQPAGSRLHSQWGYLSRFDTFYVFLYQDRPDAPVRRIESNVHLEKR